MDGSTSRDYAFREVVDAKSFQRGGVEMTCQDIFGIIVGKHPVVEHRQEILIAESLNKITAFVALAEHLGRVKTLHQLVDIFVVALCEVKLACRNIEKGNAALVFLEVHRCQEVILFLHQDVVVICHAGSHQLDHAAFHQTFRRLWIFKSFANSHFQTGTHQFRQICVEGMMWKTRHLRALSRAIGTACQNDTQNP